MRLIDADALKERIRKLKSQIAGPAAGFVDDDSYECGAVDALSDALKYIREAPTVKELEPRVMTLDEVLVSGDQLIWIQFKSAKTPEHYELYPTSPYTDNGERWNTVSFQSGHVQMKHLYGKQWRCWTAKPSTADAMNW